MASTTIDSGTTAFHTVSFFDKTGAAAVPTTVYSSLYGPNGIVLRIEIAEQNPAAVMQLITSLTENTLINPIAKTEPRRLRTRAVYAAGADELVTHTDYIVQKATL